MDIKQENFTKSREQAQQNSEQQYTQKSDNSLGNLTILLIRLLKSKPDQQISMNEAAEQLYVQKRRIYDIINVLESSGQIKKCGKNQIIWKGDSYYNQNQKCQNAEQEYEKLAQEEKYLDEMIQKVDICKEQLISEMKKQDMLYISEEDMQTILNKNQDKSEFCYFSYPEGSIIQKQKVNNRERLKIENKMGGINFVFSSKGSNISYYKERNPFSNSSDPNVMQKNQPFQPNKIDNQTSTQNIGLSEDDNKENNYNALYSERNQQKQDLSSMWL